MTNTPDHSPAQPSPEPVYHHNDGSGIGRSLLWIVAIAMGLGLVWLSLVAMLGTPHFLQATVGRSMQPTLYTGDLAILQGVSQDQIRIGDVIAVPVPEEDQAKYNYSGVILHRVTGMKMEGTTLMVETKGDNEAAPDPFTVPASDVYGRMIYDIPNVGWALFFVRSMQGMIAIGGLILIYLIYLGTKWIGGATEELIEPETSIPVAFNELALAIGEYGEHLRSHTRVVQELGGTTEELHDAAGAQNMVLADLRDLIRTMNQNLTVASRPALAAGEPAHVIDSTSMMTTPDAVPTAPAAAETTPDAPAYDEIGEDEWESLLKTANSTLIEEILSILEPEPIGETPGIPFASPVSEERVADRPAETAEPAPPASEPAPNDLPAPAPRLEQTQPPISGMAPATGPSHSSTESLLIDVVDAAALTTTRLTNMTRGILRRAGIRPAQGGHHPAKRSPHPHDGGR